MPPAEWAAARERSAGFAAHWQRTADRLAFVDAFDSVAAGSLPIARDRATALLTERELPRRLFATMTAALADSPLFDPPLRATRDSGHVGAILFETPAARMSATLVSARDLRHATAGRAIVPGHVTVTRYVRACGAMVRRWRPAQDGRLVEVAPLFPADDDIIVHDGRHDAQVIAEANGDVVMLSILLRAGRAEQAREYRLPDGSLVRAASTDEAGARTSMLLTLLRVCARTDAGAVFDAVTREPSPHLRWSAMREWLALDATAAIDRLRVMAQDDGDESVRAVARATLELAARQGVTCPA